MPYYIGEDMPEWEKHYASDEGDNGGELDKSLYKYILPENANATIVHFSDDPGLRPGPVPDELYYPPPAQKIGFFARLFGKKPEPEIPAPTQEQIWENYQQRAKATAAHALWEFNNATKARRDMGIKRVIGSYDGGNDESFTNFQSVELNDGSRFGPANLPAHLKVETFQAIIDQAVDILMGSYGEGPFDLRGAVTVDFETCTITDEKDRDIVFQYKPGWSN
jgi:hypothetical protein